MKAKLYTPFQEIRHKIYITMSFTVAIMATNAIINFLPSSGILYAASTLYVVTKADLDTKRVINEFIAEFVCFIVELFLFWYTTNNIDFRKYMFYLMVGVNQPDMIAKISIFLIYAPQNSIAYRESFDEDEPLTNSSIKRKFGLEDSNDMERYNQYETEYNI